MCGYNTIFKTFERMKGTSSRSPQLEKGGWGSQKALE